MKNTNRVLATAAMAAMKHGVMSILAVGLAVMSLAGSAWAVTLYDSNAFEAPTIVTGPLAGQDGWTGSGVGGGAAPWVVTGPDPVLGQQAVRLEVPDLQGAASVMDHAIPAINLAGQVVTVSFDIYRQQEPWLSNLWWWWWDAGVPTYGLQWDAGVGNPGQTLPNGWNPGAGAAVTVMGRYANLKMVWDFQQEKAYSWYDGVLVDNGIPITNIGSLTGWTIQLSHDDPTGSGPEVAWIDNFSVTVIPEPSSLTLLLLALPLLLGRRKWSPHLALRRSPHRLRLFGSAKGGLQNQACIVRAGAHNPGRRRSAWSPGRTFRSNVLTLRRLQ